MNDSICPVAVKDDSGAAAALAGYDYQVNVSVLAALRILFVTKSATRITLEPANADDIEVELDEDDPGHLETQTQLGCATRLIMQVKLRSGDPWSLPMFERLLQHGKRRKPAKDHLVDLNVRYLLVTNADVSGAARKLLVKDFEEPTSKDDFPASLRKILPNTPEGRVAIYAGLSSRLLEYEIGHILTDVLRVPKDRQAPCLTALCEEAKVRIRGSTPGVWLYEDLLGTIRNHGGFLASVAELDAFVSPTNFPDMIGQLEKKNAIVLTGSSGTGKTLAAQALCDHARKRNGNLEVVVVNPNNDPSSIRQIVQTGPKLFYVEDPWGQNSLRTGSETWTEQLPRMLRNAHPGNQFVVTSRSDMLRGAQAVGDLTPWSVELEADHYLNGRFKKIYDRRMNLLPSDLQSKALSFRADVLRALEKPLELDLFFANILSGRAESETDAEWLHRLIGLAHRNAVEGVVGRFLDHADATGQSAVIWGVLAARGSFDRMQLIALMRALRVTSPDIAVSLDKLIDTMIAARHLRQPTKSISFAHPSVRAGFEKHLKQNWFRHESAFASLLTALTTLPQPHADWGIETAARLIDEGKRLVTDIAGGVITFDVPAIAQTKIDNWLEDVLLKPDVDFPKFLQLASDVGSSASNPSELARWLLTKFQRGGALFKKHWKPPTFSKEWYERLSEDTRSFLIAERFIRDQLSDEHGSYGSGFPAALDRIATGLTNAYLQAARNLVGRDYVPNADAVIVGALRDLPAFETIFEKALDDLKGDDDTRAEHIERWRAIEDGECDFSVEEYYTSYPDDDGYSSALIIERYIEAVHTAGDWKTLAEHSRVSEFSSCWARTIQKTDLDDPPSVEEMAAMLAAAQAGGHGEDAWLAMSKHWYPHFRKQLKTLLIAGTSDQGTTQAALACAMSVDRTLLAETCETLQTAALRITFLCDLIGACRNYSKIQKTGLRSLLQTLAPSLREIGRTLFRDPSRATPLSLCAVEALWQAADTTPPSILSEIIPLLIRAGEAPVEPIRRWLRDTTDKDFAKAAASAAVKIQDTEAIAMALRHPRANAREVALEFLVGRADLPFSAQLLALATDPSHRVRRVLVQALVSRPHPEHFSTLVSLTGDTWSDGDPQYYERDSFPIAREAVEALVAYAPLSDRICDQLIKLAISTTDRALGQVCLRVTAGHGTPAARKTVRAIIRDRARGWLRLDALNALVVADKIEPELLMPFTAERIIKLSPPLATSATVLICRHATLDDAVALCQRLAHSNANRSLAVVGAYFLHNREPTAGCAVLDLLPEGHPVRRLFQVEDGLLPASVLNGLGDIKRQRWVQKWLSDRIAET